MGKKIAEQLAAKVDAQRVTLPKKPAAPRKSSAKVFEEKLAALIEQAAVHSRLLREIEQKIKTLLDEVERRA